MGLLERIFGGTQARDAVRSDHRLLALPDDDHMSVVGESFYQDALRALAARCTSGTDGQPSFEAVLVAEPDNPYDANAIAVHGPTGKVGHLSRETAERYAESFELLRNAGYDGGSCIGLLNGGDPDRPNYGVVLKLAYPETCEERLDALLGGRA